MAVKDFQKELTKIALENNCYIRPQTPNVICLQNDTNVFILIDKVDNELIVVNQDPISKRKESSGEYYDMGRTFKSVKYNPGNYEKVLKSVKTDIIKRQKELMEFKKQEKIKSIKSIDI